jgi:hypothetical protein
MIVNVGRVQLQAVRENNGAQSGLGWFVADVY